MLIVTSSLHEDFEHDVGPLGKILEMIDDRFGPIKRLHNLSLKAPQPRWYAYACELSTVTAQHFGSAGTSIHPTEALTRALGEAVERLSAINSIFTFPVTHTIHLDEIAFELPRCAEFESTTIKGVKNNKSKSAVKAAPFMHLSDGKTYYLPAAFLHLGYKPIAGEEIVTLPISTGLAFAPTEISAIWSGLCEVAERDALMVAWWTMRALRVVDITSAPIKIRERHNRILATGLELRLFDMTTEMPGAGVFCMIISNAFPYVTVGASYSHSAESACIKAIDEAISIRIAVLNRGNSKKNILPIKNGDFNWVNKLEDHCDLYAHWQRSPAFDFLLKSNLISIPFKDFENESKINAPFSLDELKAISRRLQQLGFNVLWQRIPNIDDISNGVTVKVVVPEMLPLSQFHSASWLGSKRLLSPPFKIFGKFNLLNPYPHPFA